MKKRIFQIFIVMLLLLCFVPSIAQAQDATSATDTYTVTVTARHNNRALSNVTVMISQNGETITYKTTNRNGVVTFELADGTYTAVIGYVSGNYSYYGTTEFSVDGATADVTVDVDSEFTYDAAKEVYNKTSYYDHVDVRVNGTFTTGTNENKIIHNITLKNVELLVVNGNTTLIDTTFEDNTELYEWRVTGKQIPNTAKVSLIFDILLDGKTMRENYTYSFEGEEDFIQAIINCDQNQGLDFIIDPTEIVEAVFYKVSYQWTDLPEGLATPPGTTGNYEPNDLHTIDSQWKEGVKVVDEVNGVVYTFSGWYEWSDATDSHTEKNELNTEKLTITNDTIVYGKWESTELEYAKSHIDITKGFNGNGENVPENLYFTVTDPNNYVIEIPYSAFTNGSYSLPVYAEGDYIIEEHNVTIPGYSFESATIDTDFAVKNTTTTSITITVDLEYDILSTYSTTSTLVDTISFTNNYVKKIGENIYNYPSFVIEKADEENRKALSGAIFTLTPTDLSKSPIVSLPTNTSGYTMFSNILEGTYTLAETTAPKGYYLDNTEHTVTVSLKENSPTEQYSKAQDAYVMVYDYVLTITPDENYNANDNAHRLTVYNQKITGNLTISKNFGEGSALNKDNFTGDITVLVTGDKGYQKTVTLNLDNNWTVTLTGLELDRYIISEVVSEAEISGYDLEVSYSNDNDDESYDSMEANLSDLDSDEEITITNTYTENTDDDKNDENENNDNDENLEEDPNENENNDNDENLEEDPNENENNDNDENPEEDPNENNDNDENLEEDLNENENNDNDENLEEDPNENENNDNDENLEEDPNENENNDNDENLEEQPDEEEKNEENSEDIEKVEYTEVSVEKKWYSASEETIHPESVEVGLYKDGVIHDTQILSNNNNWAYTWTDLIAEHQWSVDELNVPGGYDKAVEKEGNKYVITNYYNDIPATGDEPIELYLYCALTLLSVVGFIYTITKYRRTFN